MDSASSDEPIVEEVAPKRRTKKVQLVPLGEEPAPAPPKRRRTKLTDENSEPASVAFKSARGDVSFPARKRAKPKAEAPPEAPLPEAPPPPAPLRRQGPTRVQAPPTPGLYDLLHEHLSARGAERSQRWGQFLAA